jgi:DNA repair protein RadC
LEFKNKHINIKNLAEDDRPREKLATKGKNSLSDAELLAIVLGSGNIKETAIQLAQRILSENDNSLANIAKLNINELKKYRGVGTVKAINIIAAFEIGRRRNDIEPLEKNSIKNTKQAYEIFKPFLSDLRHEEFWICMLDKANHIIKTENVSKGGISATIVDIKLICKRLLECNATGIILAHNHPSGNLNPSAEDIKITKNLKEAISMFDINLYDHIIVGENNYTSFADKNLL